MNKDNIADTKGDSPLILDPGTLKGQIESMVSPCQCENCDCDKPEADETPIDQLRLFSKDRH